MARNSGSHQWDRDRKKELTDLPPGERHASFMKELLRLYGGRLPAVNSNAIRSTKTDHDALKESFRFIRSEEDDMDDTWEVRLAKRYYSKLYREYAIADMSRYGEGKLGLRWRTQSEVVSGRGQLTCGARGCSERMGLASFEVPFSYNEAGQAKSALVKVRLCPEHARQLHQCKEGLRQRDVGSERGKRRRHEIEEERAHEKQPRCRMEEVKDVTGRKHGKRVGEASGKDEADRQLESGPVPQNYGSGSDEARKCFGNEEFEAFFAGLFE